MNKDRTYIHNRLYYFLFLILSFSIPLYDRVVALAILLILINWLIEGRFRQKFQLVKFHRFRLYIILFSVLYFAYLSGLLYSKNQDYGLFDIQIKLSLFLFPLIFATIDFNILKGRFSHFLYAFAVGCFLSTIILMVHSFVSFLETKSISEFFYGKLAWYIHASYIAMFLVFAVGLITYYLQIKYERASFIKKIILVFLLTYFFIFIIMLSSKAGIISLAFVLLFNIGYVYYKKQFAKGTVLLIILIVAFYGVINAFSVTAKRLSAAQGTINSEKIEKDTHESTAERLLIWKSSLNIIKDNFLFGVGTGDVKDHLLTEYKNRQISNAYQHKLNAHNQYLQTFISIGVFGFLILIACLVFPAFLSIKKQNVLYLLFLFLISFNFLFESMLERQAGVVFYAFFNSLLFYFMVEKK